MPPVSYFFQYSTKMGVEKAPPIKKGGASSSFPLDVYKRQGQGSLKAVADSDKKSKIPYVELKMGETGAAIGLLKIGFQNPDGDQSDTCLLYTSRCV